MSALRSALRSIFPHPKKRPLSPNYFNVYLNVYLNAGLNADLNADLNSGIRVGHLYVTFVPTLSVILIVALGSGDHVFRARNIEIARLSRNH